MIKYSYNKCPHQSKEQLVLWYQKYFKTSYSEANSKHIKQLKAIWHRIRMKGGELNVRE